jgi:hypothetical protein
MRLAGFLAMAFLNRDSKRESPADKTPALPVLQSMFAGLLENSGDVGTYKILAI